jgi:hypothetical protein
MTKNPENESRGFVYIAFGDEYVSEASESAQRVLATSKLPSTLITDVMPEDDFIRESFDQIVLQEFRHSFADKIRMRCSPYDRTIFLDSDTIVVEPLDDIFSLLDRFDLAVQFTEGGHHYQSLGISPAFDEPSAGILAWKRSQSTEEFFDRWESDYKEIREEQGVDGAWDQRSLKSAIWHSDIRIAPLSANWQFCTYKPNVVTGSVKMLHGRNISDKVIIEVNESHELRTWLPKVGSCPAYSYATILELCRFFVAFGWLIIKQIIRRTLHFTRVMPFPKTKRLA